MRDKLLVKETVMVAAPAASVWEVLTTPQYIQQWDDIPESFEEDTLQLGTTLEWEGYATLTVVDFEPHALLRLRLYDMKWDLPPTAYNIAYTYTLAEQEGQTQLNISIGDFAVLYNGESYYEASEAFAQESAQKIKALAEALTSA